MTFLQWASSYLSDTDSDADPPEPDLVQDDLASRRFHSVTSVAHELCDPFKASRPQGDLCGDPKC